VRLIHVEVEYCLAGSDAGGPAAWFSERPSHSFLQPVRSGGRDHAVFTQYDVGVGSEADDVARLAELVQEDFVGCDTGRLERVVADLDWSLGDQADFVLVCGFRVTHREL